MSGAFSSTCTDDVMIWYSTLCVCVISIRRIAWETNLSSTSSLNNSDSTTKHVLFFNYLGQFLLDSGNRFASSASLFRNSCSLCSNSLSFLFKASSRGLDGPYAPVCCDIGSGGGANMSALVLVVLPKLLVLLLLGPAGAGAICDCVGSRNGLTSKLICSVLAAPDTGGTYEPLSVSENVSWFANGFSSLNGFCIFSLPMVLLRE